MKEWFKARNLWGAAINALTDEEAGRLAKAVWAYTMTGEQLELSGAEKGVFAMILMQLGQDEQASGALSQTRSEAGSKGGRPKQESADCEKQTEAKKAIAFSEKQTEAKEAIADNIETEEEKEEEGEKKETTLTGGKEKTAARFTPPTAEQVRAYCRERGNRVDAERFVDFYVSKGWRVGNQPMKDWRAAVRNWERDGREAARASPARTKTVSAQQYEQREYQPGELDAVGGDLMAEARAMREAVI